MTSRASLPSLSMHRLSEQQLKTSIINSESSITKEKLVELLHSSKQQNVVSKYSNSTSMQENFLYGKVSRQEFVHSEEIDSVVKESISSSINRTEVCSSVQSDDSVFTTQVTSNSEEPPALPIKKRTKSTRKERLSQYDNVEELDSFSRYKLGSG